MIIYSWRSHANAPLHVMKSEIVLTCVKTWRPRPSLCLVRNELWCTNFLKLFGPLTLFCVCNFQIVRNGRRDSGTQITDGKVASMVIESTSRAYCESAAQTGKLPHPYIYAFPQNARKTSFCSSMPQLSKFKGKTRKNTGKSLVGSDGFLGQGFSRVWDS